MFCHGQQFCKGKNESLSHADMQRQVMVSKLIAPNLIIEEAQIHRRLQVGSMKVLYWRDPIDKRTLIQNAMPKIILGS